MTLIVAIADDLSGAAETAAALMQLSAQNTHAAGLKPPSTARVVLVPDDPADTDLEFPGQPAVVLDSDSRRLDAEDASARLDILLRRISQSHDSVPFVFLKVDSLLRGHVSSDLRVLLRRGPVILAPALPALGRGTIGGVVHSEGVPLHETSLWSAEDDAPPATIAEALAPLSSSLVGLDTVRGDAGALDRALGMLENPPRIAICDAETTDDLEIIAAAALRRGASQLAGASALGSALARSLMAPGLGVVGKVDRNRCRLPDPAPNLDGASVRRGARQPVMVVVGTASAKGRTQVEFLAASGVPVVSLTPSELLQGTADPSPVRVALLAGPVAVAISLTELNPGISRALSLALAEFVAPLARRVPLILTGGETARSVLNALGIQRLDPLAEIRHGAVLSVTDRGTLVVTRPGTFGGRDSLRAILDSVHSHLTADTEPLEIPRKAPS
jgi:uncharacterized protein YgbK (DUF1537 family)